jgi:hypothetical protein
MSAYAATARIAVNPKAADHNDLCREPYPLGAVAAT